MAKVKATMKVWFDHEGDYLEVLFDSNAPGFFRETSHDQVMKKVDSRGRVLGFSVLKVSRLKKKPFAVALAG